MQRRPYEDGGRLELRGHRQAKDAWRHRKLEEARKDLPLEPPACGSAGALSLDFQPPELKNGRINLLF